MRWEPSLVLRCWAVEELVGPGSHRIRWEPSLVVGAACCGGAVYASAVISNGGAACASAVISNGGAACASAVVSRGGVV